MLTDVAVFHCTGGIFTGVSVINLVAGLGLKQIDSWCNLQSCYSLLGSTGWALSMLVNQSKHLASFNSLTKNMVFHINMQEECATDPFWVWYEESHSHWKNVINVNQAEIRKHPHPPCYSVNVSHKHCEQQLVHGISLSVLFEPFYVYFFPSMVFTTLFIIKSPILNCSG